MSVFSDRCIYYDCALYGCRYLGHGSGSKYFSGESVQGLPCRAVSILMGCSSGKLMANGRLEGSGIIMNYLWSGW